MCYNPNRDNLITTQKEDGLVEVYGCHFNCMQKMNTTAELFSQFAKTHPRFVAREEQLKAIRDEQQKAVFNYGSKDYQNFQI
jgi:malate synthase